MATLIGRPHLCAEALRYAGTERRFYKIPPIPPLLKGGNGEDYEFLEK